MKREYDFSTGKRGALLPSKGKTRITIFLDDVILAQFRTRAETTGTGYQSMINEALKVFLSGRQEGPVTESVLRQVIREEVPKLSRRTTRIGGRGTKHRAA
ncbi:MAG: CopG family transcriptional regulator [Nitrospiraceae bacterium]|jgi:hypothetical protein|nr:CopG family transcriptional regulator [Nitrospiraceae bacterium]